MKNELIKTIEKNTQTEGTSTQKNIVYINSSLENGDFDIVDFCLARDIELNNMVDVSKLLQFGKDFLEEFWNYCKENFPDMMESLKNPKELYSKAVAYQKGASL